MRNALIYQQAMACMKEENRSQTVLSNSLYLWEPMVERSIKLTGLK